MATPVALAVSNLVCDLDGVVYLGETAVPGSGAALARFADAGVRIVFATNNSTTDPDTVADKIARVTGFPARAEDIITSSIAAARMLEGTIATALCVGERGIDEALASVGIAVTDVPTEADAVVVGLDRHLTYDRLRLALIAIEAGAALVATNTDATYPTDTGSWPGGGAIVAAIERAANVVAVVAGKPHRPMYDAIAGLLQPGPTAIVGDRAETDLALGVAGGWTKVLVLSGVTADPAAVPSPLTPDVVAASIADLVPGR